MRLVVTTPTLVAVHADDVIHVRAEDETGAFGIQPGHTEFLTALTVCVVSWRSRDGRERHCAARSGVLSVTGGGEVAVATREAVVEDDLQRLEHEVLARFRRAIEEERQARVSSARLHAAAIRQILRYLRPEQRVWARLETVDEQGRP